MPLQVYTARITSSDPDALNITRKSGTTGLFLAPSWSILGPAIDAMRTAKGLRIKGIRSLAEEIEQAAWATYAISLLVRMRALMLELLRVKYEDSYILRASYAHAPRF